MSERGSAIAERAAGAPAEGEAMAKKKKLQEAIKAQLQQLRAERRL
jgi:hypothetical protein